MSFSLINQDLLDQKPNGEEPPRCRHMFKNGDQHCSNPAVPGSDRCLFHQSEPLDWQQPYAQKLILDAAKNGTLEEAHLTGANLKICDLSGVNLKGADLSNADLTAADLSGADCRNVSFAGACLLGAKLDKADCARTNFDNADCQVTSFNGTVLRKISCYRTDFRSTNLSRAVIAADALADAKTDDKTVWPGVIPNGTGSEKETDDWTVAPMPSQSHRHTAQATEDQAERAHADNRVGLTKKKGHSDKQRRSALRSLLTVAATLLVFILGAGVGGAAMWFGSDLLNNHFIAQYLPHLTENTHQEPLGADDGTQDTFNSTPKLAERLTELSAERDDLQQALAQSEADRDDLAERLATVTKDKDIDSVRIRRHINQLQQTHDQALLAKLRVKEQDAYIAQLESHLADQRRTATILTDGVSFLENRNAKLEDMLNSTLGREKLLADSEAERAKLLAELTVVTEERDLLQQRAHTYEQQLLETSALVNNLVASIEGTRLQGLLTARNSGQQIDLRPGTNATLVNDMHALSIKSDIQTTSRGMITLQGKQEVALPRIMFVFSDENGHPLRKLTYDFADHRLDQGFVTLRYDTGLEIQPSQVRISLIDPVMDRLLENVPDQL